MKKTISLFLMLCCTLLTAAAQDLIVKTDSAKVEAKVLEISTEAVRYKRFANPDGPTYVLPVAQIAYIRYANGEKEFYTQPTPIHPVQTTVPATPANVVPPVPQSATQPATQPTSTAKAAPQYVLKRFEVGDLYDFNGLKGIVCQVGEDGQHGLLLSLDEIYLHWSEFRKPNLRVERLDDRSSGEANMAKLAAAIANPANKLTWEEFPAFKWCRDKGEGWYLPSIDEMLMVGHNYNGGTRVQNNRQARNKFNDTLKENGGKRMDRLVYYFSSTEKDEKNAYTTHMGIEPPYVIEIPKYNKFIVRAMHKF